MQCFKGGRFESDSSLHQGTMRLRTCLNDEPQQDQPRSQGFSRSLLPWGQGEKDPGNKVATEQG